MRERILVVGVGSPVAGDDAGLRALAWLQARLEPCDGARQVTWLSRERPGVGLLDAWRGAGTVVLLDAMVGGGVPGAVRRLAPQALIREATTLSSHSVGVAEALALAAALEALPPQLFIYGIECGAPLEDERWLAALAAMICADLAGRLCLRPAGQSCR